MMRRSHVRRLMAERLEDRSLMAGVVEVIIDNATGELRLIGDDEPNGVQVTYMGFNQYTFKSRTTGNSPNSDTTIVYQGQPLPENDRLTILSGTDFYVNLNGGDDFFDFIKGTPPGSNNNYTNFRNVEIDMGHGEIDEVSVDHLQIIGDLTIVGGQSDGVNQSPIIRLGIQGANRIGGDLEYFGGDAEDDFRLAATRIDGDVSINTFTGDDVVIIGDDVVEVFGVFGLDTGAGNDRVTSIHLIAHGGLSWNLGSGTDRVSFESTAIHANSTVNGGTGHDVHDESPATPLNNFVGIFTLDVDRSLTPPSTPQFPIQPPPATLANPESAMMRFENFDDGQPRTSDPNDPNNPNNPNNPTTPTGGRWVLRSQGAVVVSTTASPNLSTLENLVSTNTAPTQPTVTVVNNRLLVSGTDGDDLIFVSNARNGRVRVRVGSLQLGTFDVGLGLAVNSYGGYDTVYVAESISVSTMIGASLARDMVVGSRNMVVNDNGTVYSNQRTTEDAQYSTPTPATQDAALLLILGQPGEIEGYDPDIIGRRQI